MTRVLAVSNKGTASDHKGSSVVHLLVLLKCVLAVQIAIDGVNIVVQVGTVQQAVQTQGLVLNLSISNRRFIRRVVVLGRIT